MKGIADPETDAIVRHQFLAFNPFPVKENADFGITVLDVEPAVFGNNAGPDTADALVADHEVHKVAVESSDRERGSRNAYSPLLAVGLQ